MEDNVENYYTSLLLFPTFKNCFWNRLKSKSSPCFPGSRSLNLLCVLSAPQHSLATLTIPPRLTCVCVYVTLVLQHKTTAFLPGTPHKTKCNTFSESSVHGIDNIMRFNARRTGFGNLAHYFAPLSCLSNAYNTFLCCSAV